MYFFLKYIVTLFYKKLRIKKFVCLLRESGPWSQSTFGHVVCKKEIVLVNDAKVLAPKVLPAMCILRGDELSKTSYDLTYLT